jgi:hypothetical protein
MEVKDASKFIENSPSISGSIVVGGFGGSGGAYASRVTGNEE